MGVKHHRELEVWQLADRLRRDLIKLTSRDAVGHDRDFCGQALRASNSACRNIAEGFWRFRHKEFAHFVNIAKGSLGELLDSTDEALEKQYIDAGEYKRLNDLIDHALAASISLHEFLDTTPTPPRGKRHRQARGTAR